MTHAERQASIIPTDGNVSPSTPWALFYGLLIFVVKVALHLHGLSWTINSIRRRTAAASEEMPSPSANAIAAIESRVALAGALYPGRAACLEQSLVLYYLLRRLRAPVQFRLGVQAHPFLAHAWVEVDGQPVNDIVEHVKWFTPLPDLPP